MLFFPIRVKGFYSLYFMDGSNLTHKLQLSIILCGKAIKEEGNPKRSSFGQEPGAVDPALLTLGSEGCLMKFRTTAARSLQNCEQRLWCCGEDPPSQGCLS